jgi:ribosomal RNA assembly protein
MRMENDHMQFSKLPKNRVGVLIGKKGEVKIAIEERTGVIIDVESTTGEVTINSEKAKDPIMALKVIDIIKAIGRGFSPEKAFMLFNENVYLRGFDIREYTGKNPKHVRRIRARLIGSKGKTRKLIEELSNTNISILGNTIYIIGDLDSLEIAESAVDMLLSGSEHASVYRFLESKRRDLKISKLDYIEREENYQE